MTERQEVEFASSACVAKTADLLFPLTQKQKKMPPQVESDTFGSYKSICCLSCDPNTHQSVGVCGTCDARCLIEYHK